MPHLVNMRDRWNGMRSFTIDSAQTDWLWPTVIGLVVIATVTLVTLLVLSRLAARRRWELFHNHVVFASLGEGEVKILAHMVGLLKLKDPTAILASDSVFDEGIQHLMQSRKVTAMSAQVHANLAGILRSIREKLGFVRPEREPGGEVVNSTQDIHPGSRLTVLLPESEPCEVKLVESGDTQLMLETFEPLQLSADDKVIVRYSTYLSLWEFDATVVDAQKNRLALAHSSRVRLINRRRFSRVTTDCPARLGKADSEGQTSSRSSRLPLHPARLVEIAGVGVVLKTDLRPAIGEQMLVTLEFDSETTVKSVAWVRSVDLFEDGELNIVALELAGLSDDEISEMVRQTNLASERQAAENSQLEEAPV